MSSSFNERRRQQFLTEAHSNAHAKYLEEEVAYWKEALYGVGDSEEERRSLARSTHARFSFELLSLRYTAGVPIEALRTELADVVEAYERFQKALAEHEQEPEHPPLYFAEIADYERTVQLIGLCYLLHRRDLLPRIAALQDPTYSGTDTLYEDLLAYELEDRYDVDEWYHDKPYRDLINSLYRDTLEESLDDIQSYLKGWYPAMKYAPWHDGHLRIDGTDGDYFGYWAFEAGAVTYLLDLDDTTINHMVYPKDLVAWARANKHLAEQPYTPGRTQILRAEPASIVPQSGYWSSPAIDGGVLKYFTAGSRFPDTRHTEYGDVVWYFDPAKQNPNAPDLG